MYTPEQSVVASWSPASDILFALGRRVARLCTIRWHSHPHPSSLDLFPRDRDAHFVFLRVLVPCAPLVHPCTTYRRVCFRVSSLIDTSPVRSCQFRPIPCSYRLHILCPPSSDLEHAAPYSLQFYNLCIKNPRGESIFSTCQGSHLESGFEGLGWLG
jgi:hypothetical protein